jgi:hypothetical protein
MFSTFRTTPLAGIPAGLPCISPTHATWLVDANQLLIRVEFFIPTFLTSDKTDKDFLHAREAH